MYQKLYIISLAAEFHDTQRVNILANHHKDIEMISFFFDVEDIDRSLKINGQFFS